MGLTSGTVTNFQIDSIVSPENVVALDTLDCAEGFSARAVSIRRDAWLAAIFVQS